MRFIANIPTKHGDSSMSFTEFESCIVAPNLKRVAQHWHDVCAGRRMPAWRNIRPADIRAQLPIVWAYDYDAAQNDFVGRLAGEAISGVSQGHFKGVRLSELRPPDRYPRSLERALRVVQEPALYRGEGLVYKSKDSCGYGERISLPTSNNGLVADGIFGATEYKKSADWFPVAAGSRTEVEYWFSLD